LWDGPYPLHHCVGICRSLGRAGVDVYAVAASRRTPVVRSRYLKRAVVWRGDSDDRNQALCDLLVGLGRRMERKPLLVCTRDDMAVFASRHRDVLDEFFVIPDVPPELPARLVDKQHLPELCRRHGVATPRSVWVDSVAKLKEAVEAFGLPVVVKDSTPPRVVSIREFTHSRLVEDAGQLGELAMASAEPLNILVQEYIPDECSEDWIAHGYCDAQSRAKALFTGRKVRSWPPWGGATAQGYVETNLELAEKTARLCQDIGYRGVFDLDWRLDLRTGEYNLLDFNPRVGAQFRMFEDSAGIDVVRAMHLDLSGRAVPEGHVAEGARFLVEPWNIASWLADRRPPTGPKGTGRVRLAWTAVDDLLPAVAMTWYQGLQSVKLRLADRRVPD
jgi:predicted ATP-grasp superfamily ATP-dependent carboligase